MRAISAICIRSIIIASSTSVLAGCLAEDASKPVSTEKAPVLSRSDCVLPDLGVAMPAMAINGITPRVLDAPAITMLALLSTRPDPEGGGAPIAGMSMFPPLPDGGVSTSDTCGAISATEFSQGRIRASFVGLRLNPTLDLATAYPAFGAKLAKSTQVMMTMPMRFMAYEKNGVSLKELAEISSKARSSTSRMLIWEIDDLLLVPTEQP